RRGGQTVRGTVWPWGTLARGSPSSAGFQRPVGNPFFDNLGPLMGRVGLLFGVFGIPEDSVR
ncbi:MAG: hypothetical protein ACLRV9_05895, partial [Clostridium sp.]